MRDYAENAFISVVAALRWVAHVMHVYEVVR